MHALGEEVSGELVHRGVVDGQGRCGELRVDVVNDFLHGIDRLVAMNDGGLEAHCYNH